MWPVGRFAVITYEARPCVEAKKPWHGTEYRLADYFSGTEHIVSDVFALGMLVRARIYYGPARGHGPWASMGHGSMKTSCHHCEMRLSAFSRGVSCAANRNAG